ncbi:hypothetical protein RYX36_004287 [Vicia faba]
MALYLDEEEIWKCLKHPSKRRKIGICPICLRERLASLCPDCAKVRPCSCYATTSSSSSSASSSFSRFSTTGDCVGVVGKVHNLIDRESSLRRSRSMAIPFLRSRSRFSGGIKEMDHDNRDSPVINGSSSARSFWSMFKTNRSNRGSVSERDWEAKKVLTAERENDVSRTAVMARSRSVAVSSVSGDGELKPRSKGKGWSFPSPMKVFRQSKASKVVQERSPLYRG